MGEPHRNITAGHDVEEDVASIGVVMRRASFDELYEDEYVGLVQLAHLLTGSNEAGEDIVQEAFAVALRCWDTLDNPGGYIRTSVMNAARSLHRRRGVERRLGHRVAQRPDVDPASQGELWDALLALPFRQRAALVLRFYEDRTTEEIAEALGCRPGTARSLLSRGVAALREVIER